MFYYNPAIRGCKDYWNRKISTVQYEMVSKGTALLSLVFMISHKQIGILKSLKNASVEEFPIFSLGLFLKALLDDASRVLHHKCLTLIS